MGKATVQVDTRVIFPARDRLFLTLMRLCLGSPIADLAHRFCVHQSTVSCIFNTILDLLYCHFSTMKNEIWPSRRIVDQNVPEDFRRCFPSTRVIDCTELPIENPKDPVLQRVMWSSYKNCNTLKALVAITPDRCLSFVSEL